MLGKRLKALRGTRTQQEIADKLDISRARYSHYENEHVQPDNELLQKMALVYQVTVDYLLGRTNDKKAITAGDLTGNIEDDTRDPVDKLIEYLDVLGLANEEIMQRLNFKVDDIPLSVEESKEFIDFVRVKRLMKKQQAAVSKSEEP